MSIVIGMLFSQYSSNSGKNLMIMCKGDFVLLSALLG